jgi:hypothetical protein
MTGPQFILAFPYRSRRTVRNVRVQLLQLELQQPDGEIKPGKPAR